MKSWLLLIPIGIGGAACFEHFRYLYTHKQRRDKLKELWEPLEIQHPKPYGFWQTLVEYFMLPFTYTIGFVEPGTQWRQRFFHSLQVAGRFVNPFIEWQDRNTTDLFAYLKWQLTRNNRNGVPNQEELDRTLPVVQPDFELLFRKSGKKELGESWHIEESRYLSESWHVEEAGHTESEQLPGLQECTKVNDTTLEQQNSLEESITLTWIGQSTCFVQMDGYNILTDPIFSTRTMGEWFGPRRLQPPACQISDLPPIDIVLISHNHYDHLDLKSIETIGNSATWYVPLGLKSWFASYGIENVKFVDVVYRTRLVARVQPRRSVTNNWTANTTLERSTLF